MKFSKLWHRFENASYQNKLKHLIIAISILFTTFIVIINLIWRQSLISQVYDNASIQINVSSNNVRKAFKNVEYLSFRTIGNNTIQRLLERTNDATTSSTDHYLINQTLSEEIDDLVLDEDVIKNVFLLDKSKDNLVSFIYDSKNILPNLSVDEIVTSLDDKPNKGNWFFDEHLNYAVYARNIFSTSKLNLDYLGTIIFVVDSSFIAKEFKQNETYDDDNRFLLQYQNQLYSDKNDKKQQTTLQTIIEKSNLKQDSLGHVKIDHTNYYAVATDFSDDFRFYYFIPDNNLLRTIQNMFIIFSFSTCILLLLIYQIGKRATSQITQPITYLAKQMTDFQSDHNLIKLQEVKQATHKQDEVGVLYQSFNRLISEINQLIADNYEIKILSQEIEFKALQAQLDPHFLYNTLDSINWIAVANNQEEISEMITALAYIFRKKIDTSSPFTTLDDELKLINAYISIQKMRYQNRFDFTLKIKINQLSFILPKLMIQPLIENALKYAIEKMKSAGKIDLLIQERGQFLQIIVTDNGPGFPNDKPSKQHQGIGLKNIQKRLKLYYGPEATLDILSKPFEETSVILNIPLQKLGGQYEKNHSS